jgi:hypothetical protein
MSQGLITAEVISCPGELGNATFSALQLNVEGFRSPYVLILALRAVGYKALAEQSDPDRVLRALASAVNDAELSVVVKTRYHPICQGETNE